jgi:hypothetical protein
LNKITDHNGKKKGDGPPKTGSKGFVVSDQPVAKEMKVFDAFIKYVADQKGQQTKRQQLRDCIGNSVNKNGDDQGGKNC